MNILQVVPYFPPAYAFGGPVNVVSSISKELVKRGHSVTVYTTDAESPNKRLKLPSVMDVEGIEVHYMRNLSLTPIRISNLFIPLEVAFVSKSKLKKFDVIHLHEFTTLQNVSIAHNARTVGVPYVLQTHGSLDISGLRRRKLLFNTLFGKKILRNASKLIALNKIEAEQYKRVGVPSDKIEIVPNGINLREYSNLPSRGTFKKKFNIQDKTKIILYLGRIHKTKRIDLLIKAYAYIIKTMKCGNTLLVIAGPDDGYLAEAKSLVQSSGVSNSVLFTGFINSTDKLCTLVDANVFVTPAFYGFPITFIEACAVGTPIITTSLGDRLNWVDNNVGLVTTPTYFGLGKAIYRVLSDVELAERFSKNCRETVDSFFSLERVVNKLEKIYLEVTRT
jgi:glycosyltransferase involved in cell wall biosynthesis